MQFQLATKRPWDARCELDPPLVVNARAARSLPEWRPGGPDETTAAVAAAIALSRPAAPSGGDRTAAAPTPWETLGPWRLGAQR